MAPDQRLIEADLRSPEFRSGVAEGLWGHVDDPRVMWPQLLLWIGAAARGGAPERFYVLLNVDGYRTVPPTGTFVALDTLAHLDAVLRPKGAPESRFAKVFRTDWEGGKAFYHPYDRLAKSTHPEWPNAMPHLVWTSEHNLVDYLEQFSALLHTEDYLGV